MKPEISQYEDGNGFQHVSASCLGFSVELHVGEIPSEEDGEEVALSSVVVTYTDCCNNQRSMAIIHMREDDEDEMIHMQISNPFTGEVLLENGVSHKECAKEAVKS